MGKSTIILTAEDQTAAAWASAQASASSAIGKITSLLPGLASALTAAGMISFVKHSIDAADRLNDLSKSTGISVENLSGLSLLAKQTGTDMDGLAKGINRMSVEMGKDPEKFRALGITAKDNVGAFRQFADIFNQLPDINQRNALAQAVFQKSWAELAPALSEGGTKIGAIIDAGTKASGMTTELARKSDELNDKWALLFKTGSLGNAVLSEMLPPLLRITNQMVAAKESSDGFFQSLVKFATTGGENDVVGRWLGLIDEAKETRRRTGMGLGSGPSGGRGSEIQAGGGAADAAAASAGAAHRADAFLNQQAGNEALKKQWELTQMLIDADNRWDAMRKDHIDTVRKLDDAQSASVNAQLERLAQQENAMQADFNATEQRRLEEGMATRESLRDATDAENLAHQERLANLTIYLNSVRTEQTTAASLRQALESRHQQTLLQIETNKNASVRSMQISTWQAAGELLQSFSGKSHAAAIAVIAINKGLAIAQTIQATAVATMRAFSDLGPVAGIPAAAQIQALGAVQIGLIAATGLIQASQVGGGGASLGSPANPINTTSGGAPFTQAVAAPAAPAGPATVIQIIGETFGRKQIQELIAKINENSRDGGRIVLA